MANIPNGYLYVQKETGWDASKVMPHTINDFRAVAQAIRQHRMANPQFKLNTNITAIENELELTNVVRIAAMPGGVETYLMEVGGAPPSFQSAPAHSLQAVAAVGANLRTGKDILFDWEESGQPPVAQELADKRAFICAACPKNGKGGLSRYFTVPAAAWVQARFEKLHELKMETPNDVNLGICEGCLCANKLKVWTPISFIKEHTPPEMMTKLDVSCWVLSEIKNAAQ